MKTTNRPARPGLEMGLAVLFLAGAHYAQIASGEIARLEGRGR